MNGLVYINYGRVVVDCPSDPACGNAFLVKPGETQKYCNSAGVCSTLFQLIVPSNLSELLAELDRRPDRSTRNWFPANHPLALRAGLPHGQTVADLAAEFEQMRGDV